MTEKNEIFNYTYSARHRQEIEDIRKKYLPPAEDKLAQLRRLDRMVNSRAQIAAISLGIFGALILGCGMSLALTTPQALGAALSMLIGIPLGLGGIVLAALAFPVYKRRLEKERLRAAPEILRLSDELIR